jgi:hypothetical protein
MSEPRVQWSRRGSKLDCAHQMPLPCAGVRSCWLRVEDNAQRKSPATCAVRRKPCAMPSTHLSIKEVEPGSLQKSLTRVSCPFSRGLNVAEGEAASQGEMHEKPFKPSFTRTQSLLSKRILEHKYSVSDFCKDPGSTSTEKGTRWAHRFQMLFSLTFIDEVWT